MARHLVLLASLCSILQAIDPTTSQQIQVGMGPSEYVKSGAEVDFEEGERERCELFDSCRTCTFTEL